MKLTLHLPAGTRIRHEQIVAVPAPRQRDQRPATERAPRPDSPPRPSDDAQNKPGK